MNQRRKRICILGSTGSIGRKTLEVIEDHPDRYEAVGLCAFRSADALAAQSARHPAARIGLCAGEAPAGAEWMRGTQGALDLIEACEPDLVVSAMVGAAGLAPTLRAIELGVTVGLANKEVLVTAGELTMRRAREAGVAILPIDSEHNAIFQCIDGRAGDPVRRVILTASGGPFRGRVRAELEDVTIEQALNHPTWTMGPKITIDSATLMNKGFEVIEGHHLFDAPVEKLDVVIHPQSVIHSMVEFADGSILAQLGRTDMYFPIAHTLSYPERIENKRFEPLDFARVGSLTFEKPDPAAFPCLGYAYEAVRRGGTFPSVLNAANEVAVERFLNGEIRFLEIADLIDAALQAHTPGPADNLDAIREADEWARAMARTTSFSRV